MTEDYQEYCISYESIIRFLIEVGFAGYINSEYEKQRNTQDAFEPDSSERIQRERFMFRKLSGETNKKRLKIGFLKSQNVVLLSNSRLCGGS